MNKIYDVMLYTYCYLQTWFLHADLYVSDRLDARAARREARLGN